MRFRTSGIIPKVLLYSTSFSLASWALLVGVVWRPVGGTALQGGHLLIPLLNRVTPTWLPRCLLSPAVTAGRGAPLRAGTLLPFHAGERRYFRVQHLFRMYLFSVFQYLLNS